MELKVKEISIPEIIEFNFLELKREIEEKTSVYTNLVYTDSQMKEAKRDVATLRKFTKALSDERIKVKKECMKPYEDFEAKIKELDGIVSKAIKNIDDQLKSYEEHEKAEKLEKIKELWESIEHPAEMTFEHVFEGKFLNKSCPLSTVEQYMKNSVVRFNSDIATLQNLPEFSFEAIEVYKQTLDMHKAISEGKRLAEIQKRKAETERQKAEAREVVKMPDGSSYVQDEDKQGFTHHEPLESKQWISFKALLSTPDAFALKDFFNSRGIEFESI